MGAVLPVTSVFLSVTKSADKQYLKWNIAGIEDGKISIERSLNGIQFNTINEQKFVAGSGYMDAENIVSNKLYYRLEIIDGNGKITYTHTVVIT